MSPWKSHRTPVVYWFYPEPKNTATNTPPMNVRLGSGGGHYQLTALTDPASLVVAYGDLSEIATAPKVKHSFSGPMAETYPKYGTEILFRDDSRRSFIYHVIVGDGMTFIESEAPLWENVPPAAPDDYEMMHTFLEVAASVHDAFEAARQFVALKTNRPPTDRDVARFLAAVAIAS